jgi:hypothetical protein
MYTLINTCVYTYIYVCIHTYIHAHTHKERERESIENESTPCVLPSLNEPPFWSIHAYTHAYTSACMHTQAHTLTHACIHTRIHSRMHAYTSAYTHACMHTHAHTLTHACIHTRPQTIENQRKLDGLPPLNEPPFLTPHELYLARGGEVAMMAYHNMTINVTLLDGKVAEKPISELPPEMQV